MVTLVDRKLALQGQNTVLQTDLSALQQKLDSLQDFNQLSAKIKQESEINEGDYFVTETMVASIPVYSEIKKLQDEAITLSNEIKKTENDLNVLEDGLKKEPADKAVLDEIKHELNVLITPPNMPLESGLSLYDLFASAAAQLKNKVFKTGFDELLQKLPYISVNKTKNGKEDIYRVFLSDKGKALVKSIADEERLESALDSLTTRMEVQNASMLKFTQRVAQFETNFMTEVHERAKKALESAKNILKNIKQAKNLLKDLDGLKSKAEELSIRYIALGEKPNLSDMEECAAEMAQAITDIEMGKGDVNDPKAAQASRFLAEAESICLENQQQFALGKIWKKLQKKINEKKDILKELPGEQEEALQRMTQDKKLLDDRIANERIRLANINRPIVKNDNDPVAQARYMKATDEYLNRLRDSIKKHLELFEKKAKLISPDDYLFIANNILRVGDNTGIDNVFESLKQCYGYNGDKDKREKIDFLLKPKDREQQVSFMDTLHKYRLMTELKAAAGQSSKQFLDVLKIEENKEILAKRRESPFMLNAFVIWVKSCGKPVAAILGLLDYAYGCFFAPKGKCFVDEFEKDAKARNNAHNNARHSLSRAGG